MGTDPFVCMKLLYSKSTGREPVNFYSYDVALTGTRTRSAAKKLTTAIPTPNRKTYWNPNAFQITPPTNATVIEKI